MIAARHRRQTQNIGSGTVENKKHFRIIAKLILKNPDSLIGIRIMPITAYMTGIGIRYGFQNNRMYPGRIITCKTLAHMISFYP